MSIDSTWLRCPNCFLGLSEVAPRVYGCETGHRFDRARHGYLTLLPPRAPRTVGDDRDMLTARAELLESGAYAPVAAAITGAVAEWRDSQAGDSTEQLRVADFGCGTGYYSTMLAQTLQNLVLLLADRSPEAVRRSLRALPSATGVVLDIWRPLPVRDGIVDVALNVFAPRNGAEFRRVLRPRGRLVVVVPTESHLEQLRRQGALLDVPAGKPAQVTAQLAEQGFELRSSTAVEYLLETDAATRAQLAGMGPSAHHADGRTPPGGIDEVAPADVTIAVEALVFERTAAAPR